MNSLQSVILTLSIGYALVGALLLVVLVYARLPWSAKAVAVVVTSAFYIASFTGARGLLGWASVDRLPVTFKLLQSRIVEPHSLEGDPGSIYLWVEEVDSNNVPVGTPRSYRLPYSVKLADRTLKARDEIMSGNPQEGLAEDMNDGDREGASQQQANLQPDGGTQSTGGKVELDAAALDGVPRVEFRAMSNPLLPPKP